jgi:hypothetical protein
MSSRAPTLSEFNTTVSQTSETPLPDIFGYLMQVSQFAGSKSSHNTNINKRDYCQCPMPSYNNRYNPYEPLPDNLLLEYSFYTKSSLLSSESFRTSNLYSNRPQMAILQMILVFKALLHSHRARQRSTTRRQIPRSPG